MKGNAPRSDRAGEPPRVRMTKIASPASEKAGGEERFLKNPRGIINRRSTHREQDSTLTREGKKKKWSFAIVLLFLRTHLKTCVHSNGRGGEKLAYRLLGDPEEEETRETVEATNCRFGRSEASPIQPRRGRGAEGEKT